MKEIKPRNFWVNKDNCIEAAKTCETRLEFKNKFRTAYKHCCKNGWMNDVSGHMKEILKPRNYWTKEKCIENAKKYNTIKEFRKNSSGAYLKSLRNNWMTDACSHMEKLGNLYMKVGYIMIFTSEINNKEYIYVGFTSDFNRRINQHLNSSKDNLHKTIIDNKLKIKEYFIYHDFISAENAKEIEIKNIEFYKKSNQYIILNIRKGGEGLRGKHELYTKEICRNVLKDCKTIKDAILKNKKIYEKARLKSWLKEIAPQIELKKYPNGYYTKKENCLILSKKCKSINEFRLLYQQAYKASLHSNWLCEFFDITNINKPPKYWFDKEKCKNAAILCKNRYEFLRKYSAAYQNSSKNKWLDEFFPKKIFTY